ncbi:cysteine-rich CWC family protein [Aquabacterium sp. CECT 9606]|uniref:cysteine-rich CWC family protein n=1 Tax=Aquabacterium sp. CECT 9606 TaxID=2845822 RepID=UPI001E3B0FB0|nr:cysteine-rich CWC family protein [Aquabacterium sp. CECT 9606]
MTLLQTDCPLCGGPNACAVAAGADAGSCWCHQATFSAALLARVPEDQRGQVCICARCAALAERLASQGGDRHLG